MAAQHGVDDTVLRLRDSKTGELCAVRKSGSINLFDLQQELAVSTVVECDYAGRPLPRAVTLTAPEEVLRSGRTYIATRHIKSVAAAAATAGDASAKEQQQVMLKPTVTFHNNVIVREYTLPPSPGTPSATHASSASSVASNAIRGMSHAVSSTSRLSTPGQHLTFASAVIDATPRQSMPLASNRRPRDEASTRQHHQLQRPMAQPAPLSSSSMSQTQHGTESITVSSTTAGSGSGSGEGGMPSPREMHHFSFEGRMLSISSGELSEMVRASSAFARSLDALDREAAELLRATHADMVASDTHIRQTRHEYPDITRVLSSGSGSGSDGKHPTSTASTSVRVVG